MKGYYCTVIRNQFDFTATAGTYQISIDGVSVLSGTINALGINTIDLAAYNIIDNVIEIVISKDSSVTVPMFIGTITYFDGASTIKLNTNSMWFAGFTLAKTISDVSSGLNAINSNSKWIWDYYSSDIVTFTTIPHGSDSDLNYSCN